MAPAAVPAAASAEATGSHGAATPFDNLVRLLVRTEGETGIVQVLGRRTSIGRTADNDMRIEADYISRHHAVVLATTTGPVIAATDYVRAVPESVRAWLPPGRRYLTLGTDGFGRSDSRAQLRESLAHRAPETATRPPASRRPVRLPIPGRVVPGSR